MPGRKFIVKKNPPARVDFFNIVLSTNCKTVCKVRLKSNGRKVQYALHKHEIQKNVLYLLLFINLMGYFFCIPEYYFYYRFLSQILF